MTNHLTRRVAQDILWILALTTPWVCPRAAGDLLESDTMRVWSYYQLRLTAPENAGNNFGMPRAKIMIKGKPSAALDYYFQMIYKRGNYSRTDDNPYLQELWVRFRAGRGKLKVGQFKPPMGRERFTWDGALDTVLRSNATNHLIPNGKLGKAFVRDYGVQWEASALDKRLKYYLSVQGGAGANSSPKGIAPLLGARVLWTFRNGKRADGTPDRCTLGGAFSTRRAKDLNFASALPGTRPLGYGHFNGHDMRWNLELAADRGWWRWRSEYFHARFSSNRTTVPTVSANGWYVQTTYQPGPKWSAALRYEGFDPNTKVVDRNDLRWTTLGVTYYHRGNDEKLLLNYVWKHERAGAVSNNAVIVQYQHKF